jgi:oligopeptide transport system substrate-binding protein
VMQVKENSKVEDRRDLASRAPSIRQTLRVNIGTEPPSLDPALANDITSANVIGAITDPLITLGPDFEPVPALAESWTFSDDGLVVTLHIRRDGQWSNGLPVTAHDFEWSWKRVVNPKTGSPAACRFSGIVGAQGDDSVAADDGRRSADGLEIGIKAHNDTDLTVIFTAPDPDFIRKLAHHSFAAVHPATVERHGTRWTEAAHIVTNGPFRLVAWHHGEYLTLEKHSDWRAAGSVALDAIDAVMISQATDALKAFHAGQIEACLDGVSCIPLTEADRLRSSPDYDRFPALGTEFVVANAANIADAHQRRALALALDRRWIVDNVTKAGELPATSLVPPAMPGFATIHRPFLTPLADIPGARAELALARKIKNPITLYSNNDETAQKVIASIRDMWEAIGIRTIIRTLSLADFLALVRPPADPGVDAFFTGWIADRVDAGDFFELARSGSPLNKSGCHDDRIDRLIMKAQRTPQEPERHSVYSEIDTILTGSAGLFPYIPLFWLTYPVLRKPYVKGWAPNPLGQFDWKSVWLDR